MTNRTVAVDFIARVQGYVGGVATMMASTKELDAELSTLAKTHKEKFNQVTNVALGAGAALVAVAGFAVKAGLDFDKTMSSVNAVSNASTAQMGQLRDAAIEAGKATVYSASQAAQAEAELLKAGVSVTDVLNGGLSGALALAASGQLDLASAATDTAQALNIFGLGGDKATHVADVLSAGANKSATDVAHLADSLNQAGLVSHQTGLSLEDTVGTLSLFAQNGLVGSDAGTSFKVMLQALQAPSGKTADLMRNLGINAYDAGGKFIGITALAQNLKDKLSGLTQAQRDNALAQIFGSDAVRSATILYNNGASGLQKWITAVNQSGAASENAKKQMDNLSGDVEQLKGSFETLAIQSSGGVTKGLRDVTEVATGLVNTMIKLPPELTQSATVLAGVGGTAILAATGFVKAKAGVDGFLETVGNMGKTGEKLSTGISGLLAFGGQFALVGGAAIAAAAGISWLLTKLDPAPPKFKAVANNVDNLTVSLQNLAKNGLVTGDLSKVYGSDLSKLANDLDLLNVASLLTPHPKTDSFIQEQALQAINEQLDNSGQSIAQAKQNVGDLNKSLVDLVQNGGVPQADLAFAHITKTLTGLGVQGWQIDQWFGDYETAAATAALGSSSAGAGFATVAQQSDLMNRSLGDAISKLGTLDAAFKELNGGAISSEQANITFESSLSDLTATLDKSTKASIRSGQALDITSPKYGAQARAIQSGILQTIQDAEAAAQATFTATGSVADASKTWNDYITALKATLKAAGYTDTQINDLLKSYAKMPPLVSTPITQPGMDKALDATSQLMVNLENIPKTKTVTFDFKTQNSKVLGELGRYGPTNRWGGIYQHAADGLLNQASYYSAVSGNGARYAYAEGRTGGELFVPKNGDYARSMGLLGMGAAWYGATLVPGRRGGGNWGGDGASLSTSVTYQVYPQRADFGINDLQALTARHDASIRYGRRG